MEKKFYLSPIAEENINEYDVTHIAEEYQKKMSSLKFFKDLFGSWCLGFRLSCPDEVYQNLTNDELCVFLTRVYNDIIIRITGSVKSDEQCIYVALYPKVNIIKTNKESGKFEYSYVVDNFELFKNKTFVAKEDPNDMGFDMIDSSIRKISGAFEKPHLSESMKRDEEEFYKHAIKLELEQAYDTQKQIIVDDFKGCSVSEKNKCLESRIGRPQILFLDEDNELVLDDLEEDSNNNIDLCDKNHLGHIFCCDSNAKGIIRGINGNIILVELYDDSSFNDGQFIYFKSKLSVGYHRVKIKSQILNPPFSMYEQFENGGSINDIAEDHEAKVDYLDSTWFRTKVDDFNVMIDSQAEECLKQFLTGYRDKLEDGIYLTSPSDYNEETKTYNMTPFNPKEVEVGGNIQIYKVDDLNGFYAPFTNLVEMFDGVQSKGYFYVKKL